MTDDTMALLDQIQKSTDGDFLRAIYQSVIGSGRWGNPDEGE